VAVPALAVADVVRARRRLPSPRAYLFALRYGVNDCAEILLAGPYWLLAGAGRSLGSARSIARHQRLQQWSLRTLERWGRALLGLRFELDAGVDDAFRGGGAIVVCRHVSIVDASLPALVAMRQGVHVRGVIMAELLADPGFDLIYGRTGSVFIARDDAPEARDAVRGLGADLGPGTVAAIFPEGRLYRPEVAERAKARLAERDPVRAARLDALRHTLPPRAGGLLALLHAAPHADVIVLEHDGLDAYGRAVDLLRAVPLREPVRVRARRIARADLPQDAAAQVTWLDELWLAIDRRVGAAPR
jgi:1-acyl-sn-glycerol-3-phosphate acyltransferase